MNTSQSPRKLYALDATVMVLLLLSAVMLNGMASSDYHPYSYFQLGRIVTFVAWALAAYRLYIHNWMPVFVIAIIAAVLFNPLLPIRMRRYEWIPFDHAGVFLSIAVAVLIAFLIYQQQKVKTSKS